MVKFKKGGPFSKPHFKLG